MSTSIGTSILSFPNSLTGPIVRISPNEVHIWDKDFYDTLYGHGFKLDKDPWAKDHPSGFGTGAHELHRVRRSALNPFFSTQKIIDTQDIIIKKIDKLCDLLKRHSESGSPVNLSHAYRALSLDIITEYVMTRSLDYLDREDLGAPRYRMIRDGSASQIVMNHFGWILPLVKTLPYKWAIWLFPDSEAALALQKVRALIPCSVKALSCAPACVVHILRMTSSMSYEQHI